MKSNTHLTVNDLLTACKNAQSEGVNSLLIQHNGVYYHVKNAAIVPNRLSSDLVLFVGAAKIETVNPVKSYLSFLAGAKKPKTPSNNEITTAVISTINQLFNGSDITTRSLNEIKKALASVNEHFEELNNAQNPLNSNNNGIGGAL